MKTTEFKVENNLNSPELVKEYVIAAFETADHAYIVRTLNQAARAMESMPADENPEWTEEMFTKSRPADTLPADVLATFPKTSE